MFRFFVRNAILSRERVSDRNIITQAFTPKMSASRGVKINETPPGRLYAEKDPLFLFFQRQIIYRKVCGNVHESSSPVSLLTCLRGHNST